MRLAHSLSPAEHNQRCAIIRLTLLPLFLHNQRAINESTNQRADSIVTVLGSTAEFPCGVNHDQSVKVELTWTFNDRQIKVSNRVQISPEGTLRIREARNTDVGVYTCRVKSAGGSDMRSARLDLIEIPHAPTHVRAELNVAGGLVNVSWAPPFDGNSPIVRYLVEKREVSSVRLCNMWCVV